MTRRKIPAAELRTIGLFSGRTRLEEVARLEEEERQETRVDAGPRDLGSEMDEAAIRWLGNDAFVQGNDVRLAVRRADGATLLMLVKAAGGTVISTAMWALTEAQRRKLKSLLQKADDEG